MHHANRSRRFRPSLDVLPMRLAPTSYSPCPMDPAMEPTSPPQSPPQDPSPMDPAMEPLYPTRN